MPLELGTEPVELTVVLNYGADFVTGFDSLDGAWPGDAVVALEFSDSAATVWTASVSGTAVTWEVPTGQVNALIGRMETSQSRRVRLTYTHDGVTLPWGAGNVKVKR